MFGRRQVKTHRQLMRAELGEGFGHLRQAAAHAAGGFGATVGPSWRRARRVVGPPAGRVRSAATHSWLAGTAAFVPLVTAARTGAALAGSRPMSKAGKKKSRAMAAKVKESKMSRKRATVLVSLLAAGAAAGAAGALVARRRHRSKWEEYDSQGANATRDDARSIMDNVASSTQSDADRMSDKAAEWSSSAKEAMHDWAHSTKDSTSTKDSAKSASHVAGDAAEAGEGMASDPVDYGKSKADQFSDKAASVAKNSRG